MRHIDCVANLSGHVCKGRVSLRDMSEGAPDLEKALKLLGWRHVPGLGLACPEHVASWYEERATEDFTAEKALALAGALRRIELAMREATTGAARDAYEESYDKHLAGVAKCRAILASGTDPKPVQKSESNRSQKGKKS